jgi:hypothetical protein
MEDQNEKRGIDLNENLIFRTNVSQEVITTTRDKIELVLLKTEKCLVEKNAWVTPLGLLVTCGVTLMTTDFKDAMGLDASVWNAVFILATIACILWLIKTLYTRFKNREKGDINEIINSIATPTSAPPET